MALSLNLRAPVPHRKELDPLEKGENVAVLVCHGMGQQVRFETLGLVAKAILAAAPVTTDIPQVGLVEYEGELFARSELALADSSGLQANVHIYEAYWAPLTEGKVSLWETCNFLMDAGRLGLFYSMRGHFERWLFGEMRRQTIARFTTLKLLLAWIILLTSFAAIGLWYSFTLLVVGDLCSNYWHKMALWPSVTAALSRADGEFAFPVWLILGILLLSYREFLIQYVGDVAAYVSDYKVSKFYELRQSIQAVGRKVARLIYATNYDRVILMGHSLGSVLAYDTLNAMLNEEAVAPGIRPKVKERTRALLTFGSPLDKTAFIFRMQTSDSEIREALAAAKQPLIVSYANRKAFVPFSRSPNDHFEWVNIYSRLDPISGTLDYYDADFPGAGPHVRNVPDCEALFPVVAHVGYWKHRVLGSELWKAIAG